MSYFLSLGRIYRIFPEIGKAKLKKYQFEERIDLTEWIQPRKLEHLILISVDKLSFLKRGFVWISRLLCIFFYGGPMENRGFATDLLKFPEAFRSLILRHAFSFISAWKFPFSMFFLLVMFPPLCCFRRGSLHAVRVLQRSVKVHAFYYSIWRGSCSRAWEDRRRSRAAQCTAELSAFRSLIIDWREILKEPYNSFFFILIVSLSSCVFCSWKSPPPPSPCFFLLSPMTY